MVVYLLSFMVLFLGFVLICYFDFRWLIIPDAVTGAMALCGLCSRFYAGLETTLASTIAALAVVALLSVVRHLHWKAAGRVGLGWGDVKFAGAAALWFDPLLFPLFLFVAAASALLFLMARALAGFGGLKDRLPFGPFLAASLLATWNIDFFMGSSIGYTI